ncbi:MAG: hypothetical protein ACXWPG_20715, partial [Ktedonobacteraceae bacterium]
MLGHDKHLAHDRRQGVAGFEATSNKALVVSAKGRSWQADRAQGRQIEHAAQTPAAAFGELDFPFP